MKLDLASFFFALFAISCLFVLLHRCIILVKVNRVCQYDQGYSGAVLFDSNFNSVFTATNSKLVKGIQRGRILARNVGNSFTRVLTVPQFRTTQDKFVCKSGPLLGLSKQRSVQQMWCPNLNKKGDTDDKYGKWIYQRKHKHSRSIVCVCLVTNSLKHDESELECGVHYRASFCQMLWADN